MPLGGARKNPHRAHGLPLPVGRQSGVGSKMPHDACDRLRTRWRARHLPHAPPRASRRRPCCHRRRLLSSPPPLVSVAAAAASPFPTSKAVQFSVYVVSQRDPRAWKRTPLVQCVGAWDRRQAARSPPLPSSNLHLLSTPQHSRHTPGRVHTPRETAAAPPRAIMAASDW